MRGEFDGDAGGFVVDSTEVAALPRSFPILALLSVRSPQLFRDHHQTISAGRGRSSISYNWIINTAVRGTRQISACSKAFILEIELLYKFLKIYDQGVGLHHQ